MKGKARPILRWHGGKWLIGSWIIRHFPSHRIYTEPYGGAASVLLRKTRSYSEVYNDLDHQVVNLFRVLQRPSDASKLKKLLTLTPFARDEFKLSYESTADSVELARRLIIRSFMGFGSNSHNAARQTGFRANSSRSGTIPAHDWAHYSDYIPLFVERLRGVVIENRPALEVIAQHDSPSTLHYIDPPYPLSSRSDCHDDYVFEMTDDQHRELSQILHKVKGMVIISGYRCELYDCELYPDWSSVQREAFADGARNRIEVLWMNRRTSEWHSANNLLDGR